MSQDQLERIASELAIRNLEARYIDAIFRRDPQDWGQTWTDDGEWALPNQEDPANPRVIAGRENVVEAWKQAMSSYPYVLHLLHSGEIMEIDGDRAKARWYLSETVKKEDGSGIYMLGVYDDLIERRDGQWQFRRRNFNITYTAPAEFGGMVFPHPAWGPGERPLKAEPAA